MRQTIEPPPAGFQLAASQDPLGAAWQHLKTAGRPYLLAILAANLAHFGFHILVSRALGPSAYAALGAVLGLVVLGSVPISAVEVAVIAAVARRFPSSFPRLRLLFAKASLAAGCLLLLLLVVSPVLIPALQLPSAYPVLAAGLMLFFAAVGAVPRGVLLGRMQYAYAGASAAVGAVVKLVAGAVVLANGFALSAALLAAAAAEAVHLAVLLLFLFRSRARARLSSRSLILERAGTLRFAAAAVGIWVLASADIILVRHLFPGVSGGLYVAAGLAAHTLLFIPRVAISLTFPLLARLRGADLRRAFGVTAGVTAGVVAVGAVVLAVFARPLVAAVFGPVYTDAAPLLRLLVLAAAPAALLYLLTFLHLAADLRLAALNWVGAVALVFGALVVGADSPFQFAVFVVVLTLGLSAVIWPTRKLAWARNVYASSPVLAAPASVDVSVVLPFFNPGPAIVDTISEVLASFEAEGFTVEVVASNDGSSDGSAELVAAVAGSDPRLRLVGSSVNCGKGSALRRGMSVARGEVVGFLDSDGEIPAGNLVSYVQLLRSSGCDAVIGSKRHKSSDINYPLLRRVASVGFEWVTKVLFALGVRDTQTGAKVFSRAALSEVLALTSEPGFAFDLELLVALASNGHDNIRTAPVTIRESSNSTVGVSAVFEVAAASIRIAARRYLVDGFAAAHHRPVGATPTLISSSVPAFSDSAVVAHPAATAAALAATPTR